MVNNPNTICPHCSANIPNNVKFCTECGSSIENSSSASPSNQQPRTVDNDPVESIKESGKDFMNEISSLFNKAGNNQRRSNYCPHCSAQIPNNVKFCTECGSPIEYNEPTPVMDPNSIIQDKPDDNELEQLEYLEKLASLRDKGIISDEEFEKKKKDILKI
jgi:predicted amidophosphoribosyltransferase